MGAAALPVHAWTPLVWVVVVRAVVVEVVGVQMAAAAVVVQPTLPESAQE
jgi:hypothetical protein